MTTAQSIHAFLHLHPDLSDKLAAAPDTHAIETVAWSARANISSFTITHGENKWAGLAPEPRATILHCFACDPEASGYTAAMMWLKKFRRGGLDKLLKGHHCHPDTLLNVRVIIGACLSQDELKELVQNHSRGTMPCETTPVEGNTPENMSNPAATFELRPFAEGEDLSQASPNRLLQLVKAHKADIAQLKDVGVTSTFIDAKIAKKEELIAQIVGILDTKESE